MALVMLGEQQPGLPVECRHDPPQLVAQEQLLEQLLLQPDRQRLAEGAKAGRREGEVGLEQALELEEGLVVERDIVDAVDAVADARQAVLDRPAGEAGIVAAAREALLLGSGDDAAILDERRGAVVLEGGDAEDPHRRSRQKMV